MLDLEFESHLNGALEGTADHGNVDTLANQDNQAMQPQEQREGELIDTNEENDKENDNVPEEGVLTKTFILKGLSEIVPSIKSTKIKH